VGIVRRTLFDHPVIGINSKQVQIALKKVLRRD
jgi:hypothetical protein